MNSYDYDYTQNQYPTSNTYGGNGGSSYGAGSYGSSMGSTGGYYDGLTGSSRNNNNNNDDDDDFSSYMDIYTTSSSSSKPTATSTNSPTTNNFGANNNNLEPSSFNVESQWNGANNNAEPSLMLNPNGGWSRANTGHHQQGSTAFNQNAFVEMITGTTGQLDSAALLPSATSMNPTGGRGIARFAGADNLLDENKTRERSMLAPTASALSSARHAKDTVGAPVVPSSTTTAAPEYVMINPSKVSKSSSSNSDDDENNNNNSSDQDD